MTPAMPSRTLESLIEPYPADVQQLARAARALILKVLPDTEETVDGTAAVVGYGYGTGYKGAVCTLLLSKGGVKIGVVYGAALPDPGHLLSGSGKVHRFVQLQSPTDLRSASLLTLLKAARTAARVRLA